MQLVKIRLLGAAGGCVIAYAVVSAGEGAHDDIAELIGVYIRRIRALYELQDRVFLVDLIALAHALIVVGKRLIHSLADSVGIGGLHYIALRHRARYALKIAHKVVYGLSRMAVVIGRLRSLGTAHVRSRFGGGDGECIVARERDLDRACIDAPVLGLKLCRGILNAHTADSDAAEREIRMYLIRASG